MATYSASIDDWATVRCSFDYYATAPLKSVATTFVVDFLLSAGVGAGEETPRYMVLYCTEEAERPPASLDRPEARLLAAY